MNINDLAEWRHRYTILGYDPAKASDFSALCILNVMEEFRPRTVQNSRFIPSLKLSKTQNYRYTIPYLHRFEKQTAFTEQVDSIKRILGTLSQKCAHPPKLVIDATGLGSPIGDFLRERGLTPTEVWFTGGNQVSRRQHGFNVPKGDIIGAIQTTIGTGALQVSGKLPLASVLIEEGSRMQVKQSAAGNLQYSHRDGEHDDLVFAAGVALWYARYMERSQIQVCDKAMFGL